MTILKSEKKSDKSTAQRIHFVGIAGSGMSGIAEVLLNSGYTVSGSDLSKNSTTQRLSKLGATIYQDHAEKNIKDADIVVVSTAIAKDNPEYQAAIANRVPVVSRGQMLAELMRTRFGIAIAGTHGKTTTTSLVASLLAEGGLDPTFLIGGLLNSAGSNARLGASDYLVAEADESDASFLYLKPRITVVTNIDADHTWSYDNDFGKVKATFVEFLHHLPLDGLAILCIDDEHVRDILPQVGRPMITYGFSDDADIRASDFKQTGMQCEFLLHVRKEKPIPIKLNLPGRHNVQNTLAAIAAALEVGVDLKVCQRALSEFQGIGRRMQRRGTLNFAKGQALLFDDYGHHPRELEVTIAAMRLAYPDQRLVMCFQPHRYTRTIILFEDFVRVLASVDQLLLLDIYPAGEDPIQGADSRGLCRSIRQLGKVDPIHVARDQEIGAVLDGVIENNDILLLQGAGDVGGMAQTLASARS